MPGPFYHLADVKNNIPFKDNTWAYYSYILGACMFNDLDQVSKIPQDTLHKEGFYNFEKFVAKNGFMPLLAPAIMGAERHNKTDNDKDPGINDLEEKIKKEKFLARLHGEQTYNLISNKRGYFEHNFVETIGDIIMLDRNPDLFNMLKEAIQYFKQKENRVLPNQQEDIFSILARALSQFFNIDKDGIESFIKKVFHINLEYLKKENQALLWALKINYFKGKHIFEGKHIKYIGKYLDKCIGNSIAAFTVLKLLKNPVNLKFRERDKYLKIFKEAEEMIRPYNVF